MATILDFPLKDKEVEGVFEFILDKAKLSGARKIHIDNESLAEVLVGDKEWKFDSGDIELDKENVKRRDSRIRLLMAKELTKMGISNIEYHANAISFTIASEISIAFAPHSTIEEPVSESNPVAIKVETPYLTKFYPPNWFSDLVQAMKNRESIYISGPHGCGKNRIIEEAAALLGLKTYRTGMTSIQDRQELISTKELDSVNGASATKTVLGDVSKMIESGGVHVLDEYDTALEGVAKSLNCALENTSIIRIQMADGSTRELKRHPDHVIVAAANTDGKGDKTGFYQAEKQDHSCLDRFGWVHHADYDSKTEAIILAQWLHPNVIKALYDPEKGLVIKIRQAIKNKDINGFLSFRTLEMFAIGLTEGWGWHKGWTYKIVNKFEEDYREQIRQIVRLTMGKEFIPSTNSYDSSDRETYIPYLVEQIKEKAKTNSDLVGIV